MHYCFTNDDTLDMNEANNNRFDVTNQTYYLLLFINVFYTIITYGAYFRRQQSNTNWKTCERSLA